MTSRDPTPPHYQHRVGGVLLDPYRIAAVYGLDNHALFSALKKVLAAGKRGAKDKAKDVQDAIDALVRWQEMEAEDSADAIAFGGGRASGKTEAQRQRTLAIAEDYAPDPVTAALDAVDSHDPRECAARIAELERERDEARADAAKAKRLYNELFDATGKEIQALKQQRAEIGAERDRWRQTAERAQADLDALRKTLEAERQAAVATAEELERVREKLKQVKEWRATWRDSCNNARKDADALRRELAALRDRYRPRRQSEEPAPDGVVLIWAPKDPGGPAGWCYATQDDVERCDTWTHQPPAPEGEA